MSLPTFLAFLEGLENLFIISSSRFAVFDMLAVFEAPDCVLACLIYADAPPKVVFPFENGKFM
jgi:hypothetical protein